MVIPSSEIRPRPLPHDIFVTSRSAIKIQTVTDALHEAFPDDTWNINGIAVPSGVPEQPLGQQTIEGALNRLDAAIRVLGAGTYAIFSIENGLFRVSEEVDLSTQFDPATHYEDRAVAAAYMSGHAPVVVISPASDAVRFPDDAVAAAFATPGGFAQHTAGSMLYDAGIVRDKQNPHLDLTSGTFSRQDQMARVLLRALHKLAE